MTTGFTSTLAFLMMDARVGMRLLRRPWQETHWYAPHPVSALTNGGRVWIAAVDIAQLHVALHFMKLLRSRHPDIQYLLSIDSEERRPIAERSVGPRDLIVRQPAEFSPVVRRALRLARPIALVVIGNALKYNLIRLSRNRGIPVVWIGAEFNSGDFNTWGQTSAFRALSRSIDMIFVAASAQKERLAEAGFDRASIHVTGSAKYDSARPDESAAARARSILQAAGIDDDCLVIVGGSTWLGEDSILLDIYADLKKRFDRLALVLAPRRREHFEATIREIRSRNLTMALRSKMMQDSPSPAQRADVLMMDSEGDLKDIYGRATVAFVGRSLTHNPGSNFIEAAAHGKPVIVGPHMQHFEEVLNDFRNADAVLQVDNAGELKEVIARLLDDPELRLKYGQQALRVVEQGAGALQATVDLLENKFLTRGSVPPASRGDWK